MAIHNILLFLAECPRCRSTGQFEAEFRYGDFANFPYYLGQKVKNPPAVVIKDRAEIDGYVVCEVCNKDFWITIQFDSNTIQGASLDSPRAPYIE